MNERATTAEGQHLPAEGIARVRVELADGRVVCCEPVEGVPAPRSAPGEPVVDPSVSEPTSSLEALVRRMEAVAENLDKPQGFAWLTHDEAAARLRVHPETLKNTLVRASSAATPAPAVNIGTEARPRYRWIADEIDSWWLEARGVAKGEVDRKSATGRSRAGTARGKAKRRARLRDRLRDPLDSTAPDREA